MTSPSMEKKQPPKADVASVASDIHDWLIRGGDAPRVFANFTPRQYAEVVTTLHQRIRALPRAQMDSIDGYVLRELLLRGAALPASKATADAYAAALRLADLLDAEGGIATELLHEILQKAELSASEADTVFRKAGNMHRALAKVSLKWSTATEGDRPNSRQTITFARLLGVQLSQMRKLPKPLEPSTELAARELAETLPRIRVSDYQGDDDPVLSSLTTAYAEMSRIPVVTTSASPPGDSPTPEVNRRDAIVESLDALRKAIVLEFRNGESIESEHLNLKLEVEALRRQRGALERDVADLIGQIAARKGEIDTHVKNAAEAERKLESAQKDAERWLREAQQAGAEASNAARDRLAKVAREVGLIIERFGPPISIALESAQLGPEDMHPLRVNLRQLIQKIRLQMDRLNSSPEEPTASHALEAAPRDETGN